MMRADTDLSALLIASLQLLTALCSLHPMLVRAAPTVAIPLRSAVGGSQLDRIDHLQSLLPDRGQSAFGSLLYDEHGELVLHDGTKTWLYTASLSEGAGHGQRDWYGKWVSSVREFDVKTYAAGPRRLALSLSGEDRWAIIHDVLKVNDHLYVAFYSANGTVKAATSKTPGGRFKADPTFKIQVTDDWEKQGGNVSSLESNGAHVLIDDTSQGLTLWLGYDSYHVDATAGQLGWAEIAIDKRSGAVTLIGKNPNNPIDALPKGYIAARCGGNLASSLRFGNQFVLLYYARPNKQHIMLTAALSDDPLFSRVTSITELEPPLGDEKVIEKFESYVIDGELHIIYENQTSSGHWGTGMRVYRTKP